MICCKEYIWAQKNLLPLRNNKINLYGANIINRLFKSALHQNNELTYQLKP